MTGVVPISYVVPYRADAHDESFAELVQYLRTLAESVADVVLVDGSEATLVEAARASLEPNVRVLEPARRTLNGKVGNVDTGVHNARHDDVVIADDDVRYDLAQLRRVTELLVTADLVRPQNYFDPLPWHARFDTARTLLNRASDGDWPGTLALRRETYLRMGGYAGDVMFENFELVRTVRAHGGRAALALDVLVARRPPTSRHFWNQQVRQAYDELARPPRLIASLALMPLVVVLVATGRWRAVAGGALVAVFAAALGRRRAGGARVYPASSSLLAPVWLLWRSICSWVALGAWTRGGVRYRDQRIRRAASRRIDAHPCG